jgi:hypothetical protein
MGIAYFQWALSVKTVLKIEWSWFQEMTTPNSLIENKIVCKNIYFCQKNFVVLFFLYTRQDIWFIFYQMSIQAPVSYCFLRCFSINRSEGDCLQWGPDVGIYSQHGWVNNIKQKLLIINIL